MGPSEYGAQITHTQEVGPDGDDNRTFLQCCSEDSIGQQQCLTGSKQSILASFYSNYYSHH